MLAVIRFVSFNLLWLVIARFALTDYLPIILSLTVVLFFFELKKNSSRIKGAMLGVFAAGIIFDSAAHQAGIIQFFGGSQYFIPVWLVAMWFLFAWILPDIFTKFKENRLALCAGSAFFGPLSYFWGVGFSILKIDSYAFYIVYAVFWSALMGATHYWLYGKGNSKLSQ